MRSTSSEACSIRCSISGLQRSGGTGEHSPDEEQQARRGIGGPRISSSHHAFTQPLPPASAPAASCQTAYPCLATLPAHLCPCLRASLPASPAALRAHLKWRMRPCTGHAAASPSAQMVCPSICLVSSHSMSISSTLQQHAGVAGPPHEVEGSTRQGRQKGRTDADAPGHAAACQTQARRRGQGCPSRAMQQLLTWRLPSSCGS